MGNKGNNTWHLLIQSANTTLYRDVHLAPEGDYEVVVAEAKFDRTFGGKDYIKLTLRIREDLEQEGLGETIEFPIWKRRDPTTKDPDGYPNGTLQMLSRCTGLDNGLQLNGLDDLLDAWTNKAH